MEHWETIANERRALADELESLTEEQWRTPSLCGDWTVHQLLGHLVVPHKTPLPKFLMLTVRSGGNFNKANSRLAIKEAERPPAALLADLRRFADGRFKPPFLGSAAPLTDILIHGYDARIPLGLTSDRSPEPFRHVLDLLVSPKARWAFVTRRLPALRYVATDLEWAHGEGEEVRGTAADLALAMLGRRARLDALEGPGAPAFRAWCQS